jgi:hypothetical protein
MIINVLKKVPMRDGRQAGRNPAEPKATGGGRHSRAPPEGGVVCRRRLSARRHSSRRRGAGRPQRKRGSLAGPARAPRRQVRSGRVGGVGRALGAASGGRGARGRSRREGQQRRGVGFGFGFGFGFEGAQAGPVQRPARGHAEKAVEAGERVCVRVKEDACEGVCA